MSAAPSLLPTSTPRLWARLWGGWGVGRQKKGLLLGLQRARMVEKVSA